MMSRQSSTSLLKSTSRRLPSYHYYLNNHNHPMVLFTNRIVFLSLTLTIVCSFYPSKSNLVLAINSYSDIGICQTVVNGTSKPLDCLSPSGPGSPKFCCLDKLVTTENNVGRWSRRCCAEDEFVLENE